MRSMGVRHGLTWAMGAAAVLGTMLGGCQKGATSDYDLLVQENEELRGEVDSLHAQMQSDAAACEAIQQDNLQMAQTLEDMRREMQGRTQVDTAGNQHTTMIIPANNMDSFANSVGPGATVTQRGADVVVEVAGDVLFDSGSATLKSDAKRTLDRVAQSLNSGFSGRMIRVEGHTDSDPIKKSKWASNEALSYARADSVKSYLQSRGVPESRLYVAAFGSTKPKATKQASRRVEIVVLDAFN